MFLRAVLDGSTFSCPSPAPNCRLLDWYKCDSHAIPQHRRHVSVTAKEQANIEELIRMEWDLMADLKKMLADPDLSKTEKIRVANAIAYHSIALNKLLSQKGEKEEFNEESLGDYVRHYADRGMRRAVRRDFRDWKRRLSSRR